MLSQVLEALAHSISPRANTCHLSLYLEFNL